MKKIIAWTILSVTALGIITGIVLLIISVPETLWFFLALGAVFTVSWAIVEIQGGYKYNGLPRYRNPPPPPSKRPTEGYQPNSKLSTNPPEFPELRDAKTYIPKH